MVPAINNCFVTGTDKNTQKNISVTIPVSKCLRFFNNNKHFYEIWLKYFHIKL